jgi:Bacterial sugar transferase
VHLGKREHRRSAPRPPAFFYRLVEEVPQYWQRLVVRPDVTGFAQTRITREDSWEDKLIHDLEYIADRSISIYLRVLGATLTRIIRLTFSGRNRSGQDRITANRAGEGEVRRWAYRTAASAPLCR